jgi:hypothetical protein
MSKVFIALLVTAGLGLTGCAALAGAAKDACISKAKVQFGKS